MIFEPEDWDAYRRAISSTTPSELHQLSKSSDRFVRTRVASNGYTPRHVLLKLISDPFPAVSAGIPNNPNADHAIVVEIEAAGQWRTHEYWLLRENLMSCPLASEKVLAELYDRNEWNLILGFVNRNDCDLSILHKYAKLPYDKSPKTLDGTLEQIIRKKARMRLNFPILDLDEEY
jgi:hypothetical protein